MINFSQFAERHIHPEAEVIVSGAEVLRKEGAIRECTLRDVAVKWHLETGLTVASCLRCVADEAYRHLALRYLNGKD